MFLLYILAFIIHGVFSTTPCKDGVEIVATEIKNPEDLLGNWTNAYHWVPKNEENENSHGDEDLPYECSQMYFEKIAPELLKAKEAECAYYKIPFNWTDAKLRMTYSGFNIKPAIITFGEKENWLVLDCTTMIRVVWQKVSDDYVVMVNPNKDPWSELLIREPLNLDELNCVAHNVDVGKGMSGFGICYKK